MSDAAPQLDAPNALRARPSAPHLRLAPTIEPADPVVLPTMPAVDTTEGFNSWTDDEPSAAQLEDFRRKARPALQSPYRVAGAVAMALLEVEAGVRSAQQLERVCEPALWNRVASRLRRRGGDLPTGRTLLRVHCQELSPGLADAVSIVQRGPRTTFVAMRLDAWRGRWAVAELLW